MCREPEAEAITLGDCSGCNSDRLGVSPERGGNPRAAGMIEAERIGTESLADFCYPLHLPFSRRGITEPRRSDANNRSDIKTQAVGSSKLQRHRACGAVVTDVQEGGRALKPLSE